MNEGLNCEIVKVTPSDTPHIKGILRDKLP